MSRTRHIDNSAHRSAAVQRKGCSNLTGLANRVWAKPICHLIVLQIDRDGNGHTTKIRAIQVPLSILRVPSPSSRVLQFVEGSEDSLSV